MALQLPHSQFFALTRTGGLWVRRAIFNSGIPTNELCQVGNQYFYDNPKSYIIKRGTILHMPPDEISRLGHKRFTIVRHPLNWLKSYFYHKQEGAWHPERQPIDKHCETDDFEEFIHLYLKHVPGYYTSLVKVFDRVDFVGRTENISLDLIDILKKCGERFDPQKIIDTEEFAASKKTIKIPELPKKTQDELFKAEEYVIRGYYTDGLI